jgi:hypothetical protein
LCQDQVIQYYVFRIYMFNMAKTILLAFNNFSLSRISCSSLTRLVGHQQVNFANHKQDIV